MHWEKFPAFQRVKGDVRGTRRTLRDGGCGDGAVFMRWKERFLVPDHRVRDINGASFAGEWDGCSFHVNVYSVLCRILLRLRRTKSPFPSSHPPTPHIHLLTHLSTPIPDLLPILLRNGLHIR